MNTRPQTVGLTAQLIDDVRAVGKSPLPDEVLEVARHCVLDWLGVVIGGSQEPLVGKLIEDGAAMACFRGTGRHV